MAEPRMILLRRLCIKIARFGEQGLIVSYSKLPCLGNLPYFGQQSKVWANIQPSTASNLASKTPTIFEVKVSKFLNSRSVAKMFYLNVSIPGKSRSKFSLQSSSSISFPKPAKSKKVSFCVRILFQTRMMTRVGVQAEVTHNVLLADKCTYMERCYY